MSTCTSAPYLSSQSTSMTSQPARRKGSPTLPVPEQRKSALGMEPLYWRRFVCAANDLYQYVRWHLYANCLSSRKSALPRCNIPRGQAALADQLGTFFRVSRPCGLFVRCGRVFRVSCHVKDMGQLASCACGALAGCFCREIEKTMENQVRSAVNAELALLREELASCGYCHTSNCATRS